jgi:hypothetical protein
LVLGKSDCGAIMAFKDIFCDISARINRGAYFNIDMTIVSKTKKLETFFFPQKKRTNLAEDLG